MSLGSFFLVNAFLRGFLNDNGILFHSFAPILEKEFDWMDDLVRFL